jgi:hypothetical protein
MEYGGKWFKQHISLYLVGYFLNHHCRNLTLIIYTLWQQPIAITWVYLRDSLKQPICLVKFYDIYLKIYQAKLRNCGARYLRLSMSPTLKHR